MNMDRVDQLDVLAKVEIGEDSSIFAGIEGGATHSTLVLVNSKGQKLGQWTGPALNCLLNGIERTADQISSWIRRIVREINTTLPISSLGMGLSGAEDESSNEQMVEYFRAKYPDLSTDFYLTSDSVCVAATAFDRGGVVMIAGTGSACRLIKADATVYSVGGWGHLIGDGGSGFWITMKAIKTVFDAEDGLAECEFDVDGVKHELLQHFGLRNKMELISNILYGDRFEKPRIASFCLRLASIAPTDPLAASIFSDAGEILAMHLVAISRHFDPEMYDDVPVLAVGSVFQSWPLLKEGFGKCLQQQSTKLFTEKMIKKVSFYHLEESAAVGAAILGQKNVSALSTKQPEEGPQTRIWANRKLFDQIQLS